MALKLLISLPYLVTVILKKKNGQHRYKCIALTKMPPHYVWVFDLHEADCMQVCPGKDARQVL
jgi:hypothetical protein